MSRKIKDVYQPPNGPSPFGPGNPPVQATKAPKKKAAKKK